MGIFSGGTGLTSNHERYPRTMTATPKKKIFVLDTNVILHDSSCIYQFGTHDIAIPITVLEELRSRKSLSRELLMRMPSSTATVGTETLRRT